MDFIYNSNMLFEDRVAVVVKEIKQVYPSVSLDDAKKVAVLSPSVDDKISNDDKIKRYYYMLSILDKNHESFHQVLNDMYDVYRKGVSDPMLDDLMQQIAKYVGGERHTFPSISEFYN